MFTMYSLSAGGIGNVWRHAAQRHFRPFTMECNFVPHRRNNLRDRLPLCLPLPVLRNAIKISDGVATLEYMHIRHGRLCVANRETITFNYLENIMRAAPPSVRLYSIRVTHAECVLIKFFPQERNPTRLCDAGSEALFLRDSRCESSRDNVFCIDKRHEEKEIRAFVKFIGNNRES